MQEWIDIMYYNQMMFSIFPQNFWSEVGKVIT